MDPGLRAAQQSQGRCSVCVRERVCVCLTLASVTGLILVHFSEPDLARDPFIRTEKSRFVFNPN